MNNWKADSLNIHILLLITLITTFWIFYAAKTQRTLPLQRMVTLSCGALNFFLEN